MHKSDAASEVINSSISRHGDRYRCATCWLLCQPIIIIIVDIVVIIASSATSPPPMQTLDSQRIYVIMQLVDSARQVENYINLIPLCVI